MKKILRWNCFVLIACAVGCQANPNDVDQSNASIIGGTTDTGDPGVVALYAAVPGASSGSLCTAEVIAPTVLLTAAHCVLPSEVGEGAVFQAYLGTDVGSSSGSWVAVKETHYDPAFDINQLESGHDVGIAILKDPVTIKPLPYNTGALTSAQVGSAIRLVGYGIDNGSAQTGAGVRREVTTTLNSVSSLLLEIGDTSKETCNGDSGGPAFMNIDGQETIVGTTSYGQIGCTGGGYDTRVDHYADFINGYVKGAGAPTSPPGGGTCGACPVNETCRAGRCEPIHELCKLGATQTEQKPDDKSTLANALCPGEAMSATLDSEGDEAWFSISVAAHSTLNVTLAHLPTDYTMKLYRLGSRLSQVASAVDKHDDADQTVAHHADTDGTYFVKVVAADGKSYSRTSFTIEATIK